MALKPVQATPQGNPIAEAPVSAAPAAGVEGQQPTRRIFGPSGVATGTLPPPQPEVDHFSAAQLVGRQTNNKIHTIKTEAQFSSLFQKAPSVTAGAPDELKFLIDRTTHQVYFVPPKWKFHYNFFHDVVNGSMRDSDFDQLTYNNPNRKYVAGTMTRYPSYVDPVTGKHGKYCFSLWPTDHFDDKLLKEIHDTVRTGLPFLPATEDISFRPGGPIQDRLVQQYAAGLKAKGLTVTTNLDISKDLKFMALSTGDAVGRLRVIEPGQVAPPMGRGDVPLYLGDVPPTAPPVAAVLTTQVQTYNSHLGIKYRQDNTPYFYKAFSADELKALKALDGKPVKVSASSAAGTVTAATEAEAKAFIDNLRPKTPSRLAPNLTENRARSLTELSHDARGPDGRWNPAILAAYGRKTMGLTELIGLKQRGALEVNSAHEPEVVTPKALIGIPANWYTRFMREAKDAKGVTFAERIKTLTHDPKFADVAWRAAQLDTLRKDITLATVPPSLVNDLKTQVAAPYLAAMPNADRARFRSSAPVVEDSNGTKLPNMAGAFDSTSAKWQPGRTKADTVANATAAMAQALKAEYASVWNDRAIAELDFNRVAMDETSVAMALAVMPSEQNELANGVVRVNPDLAGFFSVTGETQFGENLVTNPEAGATPDTWVDGNYDISGAELGQDIEYERLSNQKSTDPKRPHAYTDAEISSVYKAMHVIRDHFAKLEGKVPEQYQDECETKITADGKVLFKQERPWVE